MEWKEADFVRIQTPQSRRYWFHDMFVGYVLETYTGTMERERERESAFLLGGSSSNFPGHKTQGAHCVCQYNLGRTCFDSLL